MTDLLLPVAKITGIAKGHRGSPRTWFPVKVHVVFGTIENLRLDEDFDIQLNFDKPISR